jgi:hypothetical protein
MCVYSIVYWSEIHQINKYRMGLIFNGLDPTLNGENIICDSD